jgi:aryl-alcohol dehydrogenase-like predicted oxidoreductase
MPAPDHARGKLPFMIDQEILVNKRKLGRSALQVSPLAFGGNVFGWTADEKSSFALLDKFVESDGNLIDTADVYSKWVPGHTGGESETIIGKWLKRSGKRHDVIIATKVGMEMAPDRKGLRKAYIMRAVEDSLRRLQTDYIDLYQSHVDDADTPLEETLDAYADLVRQGKVCAIGASNYSAGRLLEALKISEKHSYPRYESLQTRYNLYDREEYESTLEPVCVEHGIGVLTYYSLASGFLTGKYRSENDLGQSPRGQAVSKYLNPRGFRILDALDEVAKQVGATPAAVAVAWVIARPGVTAAIASATSPQQLDALIAATSLQLEPAAIELLNQASAWQVASAGATQE